MGKIVSNFFISLDGVVESPDQWHPRNFNDEMGAAVGRSMETSHAFLMGRVLYEEWAGYWPNQGDDVPFSSFINNIRKYVVSNTLDTATWNNTTLVTGDVASGLGRACPPRHRGRRRTPRSAACSAWAPKLAWRRRHTSSTSMPRRSSRISRSHIYDSCAAAAGRVCSERPAW
jgi:hypothetical protein